MNLYHLRYFVTLARLEHYTKAAEELMITQPSLSHAISSIEEELGVKLFEKTGRNVTLTKCGHSFLKDVKSSLQILDSGINNLKMVGKGEGVITIGFLRTLGSSIVPQLIKGFMEDKLDSNINFHISGDNKLSVDLIQGLKEKIYDLVLCSKLENEPLVEFIPFTKQDLVLIVPDGHPLTAYESIDLRETLAYPQIIFQKRSGLRAIIDRMFAQIDGYPEAVYELEEDQVVAGFVANGFGIAVVPNMPILEYLNVKTIPIHSPEWERRFYMATLKDTYLAPVVQSFKQYLIDNAEE